MTRFSRQMSLDDVHHSELKLLQTIFLREYSGMKSPVFLKLSDLSHDIVTCFTMSIRCQVLNIKREVAAVNAIFGCPPLTLLDYS